MNAKNISRMIYGLVRNFFHDKSTVYRRKLPLYAVPAKIRAVPVSGPIYQYQRKFLKTERAFFP
jgi:hypothetical protein